MDVHRLAPSLVFAALTACGGSADDSAEAGGGTIVFAVAGEPETLVPPSVMSVQARIPVDQIFEPLASPGPEGSTLGDAGFMPRLAASWRWSADSSTIDFSIDPTAHFHDGRRVTANDVKFSHELFVDPAVQSPNASSLPAIDSIVVVDSATVRVWFGDRSPERFFRLAANLLVMPQHLLASVDRTRLPESAFAQAPVGSGPYRFVKWERGATMELAADTTRTRNRALPERLLLRFVPDLNAGARSVAAGESDFIENLRPEGMALVAPDGPARVVEYASPDHGYLLFNTRSNGNRKAAHPILGERALRRALGMAIDRRAVVRNALDSLAVVSTGPFSRASWAADTTIAQIPYAVEAARALLDSLGWRDANGDGIRERHGRPLRFQVTVPSVSATRRQIAVTLQEQLRQVGVDAVIDVAEPAVLAPRLTQGKFDAFIHVWHGDASPSGIVQVWGGRDLAQSANFGWYASATVDSLLDLAGHEATRDRARTFYREAYEVIVQDAPAIFLWEPRTFALVHRRIKFDRLDGSGWWMGIPTWRIPAAERLPRDQVRR
ncbi:MAG: peptide ABC transporter substrate-binding protein [Gemmatimonadaceae bacterium]|nr:peptide ABC transporter substrate-binding protein [Gemmatimonadaceae bacterium]